MKNKINILYDATILAEGFLDKALRTGIFFAAYNILKRFSDDAQFNITLYVQKRIHAVKYFKQDDLLSKFPVFVMSEDTFNIDIKMHKNKLKTASGFLKKTVYILKSISKIPQKMDDFFYRFSNNGINSQLLEAIDIYLSPLHTAPLEITRHSGIKQFMLLHDMICMIFPQYFPEISSENFWFNKMVNSLNKNTFYFCNSESTKRDYIQFYAPQLDIHKMIVTYAASSQLFSPDHDKTKVAAVFDKYKTKYKYKNGDNYILSFCTLEPRKNLPFTVYCFIKFIKKHNIDNLYFCLGGAQWDGFIEQLEKQISELNGYREKIIRLGYVEDKDANTLYSNALFFTYISQYEGFGTPPLEAMQAGTPVITSNNSSLPEVVGDSAIMIDYDNEEQCIRAFEDLYFNEQLRNHYVQKGLERAKVFSWEKTVEIMKDIIIKSKTN